jgi:hypothetical protein
MAKVQQDPIAVAGENVRLEREALSALTLKRAKLDSDVLVLSTTERDQFGRPSDFSTSQRRLAAVRVQLAALREEELDLSAQINAQHSKVAAAEAELRRAQSVKGAQRVRETLPELTLCAKRLDEAAQMLVSTYYEFKNLMRAVRTLSGDAVTDDLGRPVNPSPAPNDRLIAVSMRNSLIAALIETDLEVERLAPHARHTFGQLAAAWNTGIERWCRQCLGPQDREAA